MTDAADPVPESAEMDTQAEPPGRWVLPGLVASQLLGTSLWFSSSAALPALIREWGLGAADGGLLVAIAEMALAGGIGATLDPPAGGPAPHAWAFGEDQARYVIALSEAEVGAVLREAGAAGVPAAAIGRTGGDALTVLGEDPISLTRLRAAHENWLPAYMAGG